jgi:hypothetical protein
MKIRHIVLALALLVTVWLAWPTFSTTTTVVSASARVKPSSQEIPSKILLASRGEVPENASKNAFSTAQWAPPPAAPASTKPVAPIKPIVLAPPAPAVVAAPAEPAPSFRFIGMIQDLRSTRPSVFLALGERLLVASTGDKLEGGFTLETITSNELILSHPAASKPVRVAFQGAPL